MPAAAMRMLGAYYGLHGNGRPSHRQHQQSAVAFYGHFAYSQATAPQSTSRRLLPE